MADSARSEVLIIINGSGLSKSANVKAWKDWAAELPVRVVSDPLTSIKIIEEYTHAWIADANYLPFPSAFRSEMRKHIPVNADYAVFAVTKPLAARHFYDQKWTTDDDKHDKFGGVRYLNVDGLNKSYTMDESYMGKDICFVPYQASRLSFPYCVFQLASHEPKIIVDENFYTIQHLWYARNPINGLEYGHGGPKAFNKKAFSRLDDRTVDVTTNASSARLIVHKQCVGVHAFNWSPLATWRTAFREAAKLAMTINTIVDEDQYKEAFYRLDTWCNKVESDANYADLCLDGAHQGRQWLERVNSRADVLKINDFQWLEEQYRKRHSTDDEQKE